MRITGNPNKPDIGIELLENKKEDKMKQLLKRAGNGKAEILWYAVCFSLLGLIDQRRGSAEGTLQMTFVNLTGVVVGMLLIPSIKRGFACARLFRLWSIVCIPGIVLGCAIGRRVWPYSGQWYTAVINVAVLGYLILYIVWDWKQIKMKGRLHKGCFCVVLSMLAAMQFSIHEVLWPAWYLLLFGSFYVIGIPEEKEEHFIEGMLFGIIVWFFVQQIIAFGFRPFDYVRYRGLYSGETQNGIFYMMVFCAFTGMWFLLKKKKAKLFPRVLCFLLSAGSVGFQFLTGGRASFLGIALAAMLAYMAYDIIICNSFRHWMLQGIMLGICIILLMPAVYGCVRYLPTILHHPVWFEGEYNEDTSVRSYDPWNSDRYISFDEVLKNNIGRVLQMFHIELSEQDGQVGVRTPLMLTVHAEAPGSSPDNPFSFEETDFYDSVSIRRTIYYYYATHLNFAGHSRDHSGFYMEGGIYQEHAHNMFLQVAYDFGIIAGLLFLVWNIWCLVRLLLRKDIQGIIFAIFLTAIFVYGCAEMAVTTGQITMPILFLGYYFGIQKLAQRG